MILNKKEERKMKNEDICHVEIHPSKNIFRNLRNNSSPFLSHISEFIDNPVSADEKGHITEVRLEFHNSWKTRKETKDKIVVPNKSYIIIKDNSVGISHLRLPECLSPTATGQPNSLNEHGEGFKAGLASIGCGKINDGIENFDLYTKTKDERCIYVNKISWFSQEYKFISDEESCKIFPEGHGTYFKIKELQTIVPRKEYDIKHKLVCWLGAKYQLLLNGTNDGKKLKLFIEIYDNDKKLSDGINPEIIEVKPIVPYYKNNYKEVTKSFYEKIPERPGEFLSFDVSFGYSISEGESEQCGIEYVRDSWHPYYGKNKKIDIFLYNRMLKQFPYDKVFDKSSDETVDRWFREKSPRMQIFVHRGLKTVTTKDDFIEYKDGYEKLLKSHNINFTREHAVPCIGTSADFVIDGVIREIKIGEVNINDVLQLFNYIQFMFDDKISKTEGVITGKSINDGAKNGIKVIKEKYKIDIRFENNIPLANVIEDSEL